MKFKLKTPLRTFCNIGGHKWRYQDYTHWMKENGVPYDFTLSRTCARCNERAYFFDKWVNVEEKINIYEVKSEWMKNLPFLKHFE